MSFYRIQIKPRKQPRSPTVPLAIYLYASTHGAVAFTEDGEIATEYMVVFTLEHGETVPRVFINASALGYEGVGRMVFEELLNPGVSSTNLAPVVVNFEKLDLKKCPTMSVWTKEK